MSDLLLKLANDRRTAKLVGAVGLPTPVALARAEGGFVERPFEGRTVVLGPGEGPVREALATSLRGAGAASLDAPDAGAIDVLVFDASTLRMPVELRRLYDFFQPLARRIARNGRVIVTAASPASAQGAVEAACARGVEGFVRSLGKELGRRGAVANLVYTTERSLDGLDGVVRFLGTAHATYVDGQSLTLSSVAKRPGNKPFSRALAGKVALVTGAARGIGEATARRLAADGAHVLCVDVPQERSTVEALASALGGTAHAADITAPTAAAELAGLVRTAFGGVDVVVHNAGVTRDKTLANMSAEQWDAVLAVNLGAIVAIDEALLSGGLVRDDARVVCLSSIGGIAGNFGQTNYATTKAALIGYVAARAGELGARGVTYNAVAPGFIETRMTAKIPFVTREGGRRLNSLSQGGLPADVAQAIAFFASPGSFGVTGQVLRVCGQALVGA
jgi:3-oxoacyl-[acyl-carrier protein] reductase